MQVEHHYDKEKNVLIGIVEGKISFEAFNDIMRKIVTSTEFPPDCNTIWDLRKADLSSIDSKFIEILISIRKKYPERGKAKIAFIVDSDLSFGLTRMYEMISNQLPQVINVFRDYKEAEEWLIKEKLGVNP